MKKSLGAIALMSIITASGAANAQSFVYVSNAVSGTVTGYTLDKVAMKLEPIGRFPAGEGAMSSVVSADKKMLYVSIRSKPYHVAAFHILNDGKLEKAGDTPLPDSMAYLSTDKRGHFLLSASYGGDLFSINRIGKNGLVETPPVQVVHTGKRAHAIQVDPSNHYLYVTLLGADQMLQFHFDQDTGKVTPNSPSFINIETEAATGPRHFVLAPKLDGQGKQNMYILTEMAGNIKRLTMNTNGTFTPQEDIVSVSPDDQKSMQRGEARPLTGDDNLPPTYKPRIWQADIHITPDGKFLYSTERTNSTLSSFSVDPTDGHLTYLRSIKTEKQPRGFAIDNSGRFLIESGQKSTQLSLYAIDKSSGKLTQLGQYPTDNGANWVSIVE
ncbi:beta-propeller fold lactonase family protein [Rouxiella badensis]|uniref:lactonase family protein n=1 Tax=Rouxiella TaxID=1565532 RepID=UPI0012657E68|nr:MULTISPECIES: beta-propeller fold lactonase family protein [Rouxiella]KAB7893258.1 beta-propeller fold lactonase family protein [Rouxiella sp. S1S-2]MCC3705271.1 beta-propeller fold lactonase family protein [Rouxiella badensis]